MPAVPLSFIVYLLWFHSCREVISVIQVEIICPGYIYPSQNGAFAYTGPAFEAAVEENNKMYARIFNFSLTFLIPDNVTECSKLSDISPDLVSRWYFKRHNPEAIIAVFAPGCIDVSNVHQLTASLNILLFLTIGFEESRFTLSGPVVLGTSYISMPNIGMTFVNLLVLYQWNTAYMIVDYDSPPVYYMIAAEVTNRAQSESSVRIQRRDINAKKRVSFASVLDDFRVQSRVLLFFGRADQLRRLLVEATVQNMTNGEFVYICTEPYQFEFRYGALTWQYGDVNDEAARRAFEYLLIVHPADTLRDPSSRILAYAERFSRRAAEVYGSSYTLKDQPLREVLTCYSSVTTFAQVLHETLTLDGRAALYNGQRLLTKLVNRTFSDGLTDLSIDENGRRYVALEVSQLVGPELNIRQAFLLQANNEPFRLAAISNVSVTWNGFTWPPSNEPACGYIHNALTLVCLHTQTEAFPVNAVVVAFTLCCACGAVILVLALLRRKISRSDVFTSLLLSAGDMHNYTGPRSVYRSLKTSG